MIKKASPTSFIFSEFPELAGIATEDSIPVHTHPQSSQFYHLFMNKKCFSTLRSTSSRRAITSKCTTMYREFYNKPGEKYFVTIPSRREVALHPHQWGVSSHKICSYIYVQLLYKNVCTPEGFFIEFSRSAFLSSFNHYFYSNFNPRFSSRISRIVK